MTAIHVLAHIKRVRIPATRPAVDDLAASGEATSRDAQRLLGSPELNVDRLAEAMTRAGIYDPALPFPLIEFADSVAAEYAYLTEHLRSPAEPITARPAIPLRDGDRSVGSAGVPRGSLPGRSG